MGKQRNDLLVLAGLFCAIRCTNEAAHDRPSQPLFPSPFAQIRHSLAGEWQYTHSIFYTASLRLNPGGTFSYLNQTCFRKGFTEGTWKEGNGTVVLTSDDRFRLIEKAKRQENRKRAHAGEGQLVFSDSDEMTAPKFPGSNDTVNVYFDNLTLKLQGDTMYGAGRNRFIAGHKFSRVIGKP